ncbi:MAG: hypothetical protein K8E66_02170, partial [Phycisphaerales bacterium]|nr:hypothetical protein [Phycisphaerales bacterium]
FGVDPDRPDYTTRYARPRLDDPNSFSNARLGAPSALGTVNPNEFAADWSLLRHVTVLAPRQGGLQDVPDDVFGLKPNGNAWQAYNRVADSSRQVALGPAAQSVFRSVAHMIPFELSTHPASGAGGYTLTNPPDFNIRPIDAFAAILNGSDGPADGTLVRPMFTSGIVDVAVTDLDEIRTTVSSTWFGVPNNAAERHPSQFTPFDYSAESDRLTDYERRRVTFDTSGNQRIGTTVASGLMPMGARPQTQQLWMLDAMPSTPFDPNFPDDTGFRVRYEDTPPRVYLDDGTLLTVSDTDKIVRMNRAIEQADQEMLGTSVFLPRCTEFIVEWSLGIIDRRDPGDNPSYGQPIWHGLRRYRDGEGNGRYDEGGNNASTADTLFADYLGTTYDGATLHDPFDSHIGLFNIRGALGDWFFEDGFAPQGGLVGQTIDPEMFQLMRVDQRIGPNTFSDVEDAVAAEYCFGYVYQDVNSPTDPDDDTVRPWPWPKLIRVTMRFVDPSDLEHERTYQVEFRVPTLAGEM